MKLTNIGSIKYYPVFNKVKIYPLPKSKTFLDEDKPELFRGCLNTFFEEIISFKEEDIHLGYFYASPSYLHNFIDLPINGLTLLIFPSKGEIEKYVLNKDKKFFTNIHNNPDLIRIKNFQNQLYFHSKEGSFMIGEVILFKHNPIENKNLYEGFEEFLNAE